MVAISSFLSLGRQCSELTPHQFGSHPLPEPRLRAEEKLGIEFGSADALARLAALPYNHPARAEEILNAIETLAACWGLRQQVFTAVRGRCPE
jgi:hypothetical protein